MTVESELIADRPFMPGYSIQKVNQGAGLFPWATVREKMAAARNYWVATVWPDERPHAAPVWGIWVDDTFYFSTGRESRKTKNLTENPAIVVHLESGDDVIIVEGKVIIVTDEATLNRLDQVYHAKYMVNLMKEHPVYAVRPQTAYAWLEKDLGGSATRWHVKE